MRQLKAALGFNQQLLSSPSDLEISPFFYFVLGSEYHLDFNIAETTSPPSLEVFLEDKPLHGRKNKKTFPGGKVPNVVIIFHPQNPSAANLEKKKQFILDSSHENLRAFLDEENDSDNFVVSGNS